MHPPTPPTDSADGASHEQALFEQALSVPAAARAEFLARAAPGETALIERVLELLLAHERAGSFMAGPAVTPASALPIGAEERVDPAVGDCIGRYHLLEIIGEGGFGTVYRAEQREPLQRQVALKLIKLGMDTREVVARFEEERQALAQMDHPGIARVLDGGATDSGRPYFVMELVRGTALTAFCDEQQLDVRARLELFLDVCRAVQHAHQKGIIHRDLKPGNILVTRVDDRPVPKVIDFGIAKATEPGPRDRFAFTQAHLFIGTPAYMSPEQTLLRGADVDTRSDIYSLGVLLYELLTGRTPFDRATLLSAGYAEVPRLIRETEPPWPSQRVSRIGAAERAEVAQRRGLEAARLKRRLRGDLDRVVMKCLEKDRARRYETVHGLAMDVQRHLRHEPVLARPDTIAYRTWKFVRRRRGPVAVGLALLLALVAGLVGTLTQARRAMHASALAASEAASSRAVSDFLQQDLLKQANPEHELDRDLTLRTVLDRAAQRIDGRFPDQPLVEADLRQTLATTYLGLGEFALARQLWAQAHALRTQHLGEDHPTTLHTASSLADALRLEGAYADAERLATQVLARQRRVLGDDHSNTITTINNLGLIHSRQGRHAESEARFAEAFARRQRLSGPEHPDTLAAMHNLAGAYLDVGRHEEGERLSLETLALVRRVFGADHPHTLMTLNNLAQMYLRFGDAAAAEAPCTEALAGRRRVLGAEHPLTLVSSTTLARIYAERGKLDEAEELNRQILVAQRHKLGPDHPDALVTMNNLGTVYRDLGRFTEAEQWHAETAEKLQQVLGPEHRFTLNSRGKMIGVYCDQQRWTEAERLGGETLAQCERVLGSGHPYSRQAQRFLGLALLRQNRPEEAEPLLRGAIDGEGGRRVSWPNAVARSHLGETLLLLGRRDEAEPLLLEAHRQLTALAQRAPPADRALITDVARLLGELYRLVDRPADAARWAAMATASPASH